MKLRVNVLAYCLLVLQLLSGFEISATTFVNTYQGKIVDDIGNPIPFATVVAISPSDSTYVIGTMTDDMGQFAFETDIRPLLLKITYIGFLTKWINPTSNDMGIICLQPETTKLDEVVVTAKKAKVTRDGLNYSISNLSGTHIGDAGTLYDMLGWTPGIITYDINNIKAGGSTSVGAIYINEQKVTDRNILLSIPSNQVSKIEVIRDLGVRYSAESGAVIKITLKKQLKDYMGVSVTNNLEIRRRVSDDGWVNLSGKYGKFSFSGSLVGQYVNRKADYNGGTVVFGSDETTAYRDVFDSKYTSVRTGPLWSVGLNYLAKPTLNFIIQYSGSSTNVDFNEMKIHQLLMNGAESTLEENKSIPHRKSSGHNLTSGFTYFSPTGHFFNATLSYSRQNNGETQFVDIFNTVDNILKQKNIASNSIYDLLDAEANWRFSHKGSDWGLGYNLSMIHNSYDFINDGVGQSTIRNDYTNTLYGSWGRKIKKLKLDVGARMLFNKTELKQEGQSSNKNTSIFRPYVGLRYTISDNYSIGTYYTMFVGYPTISQLNPAIVYSDTLHYKKGNADLKNIKTHKIALFANIKDITIGIDYMRINNMIVTGSFPFGENGAIIDQPINSLYSNNVAVKASYSTNFGKLRLDPEVEYSYQFTKLPSINGMFNREFGQHNIFVSCDVSYQFWKTAEAFGRFSYQSPWYDSNMRIGRTLRFDIGMSKIFFDGKLRTAIELTDLFAEGVTPRWSIDFFNVKQWNRNRYDTRGVKLSLRYTFNSISTSFRNAQINKSSDGRVD